MPRIPFYKKIDQAKKSSKSTPKASTPYIVYDLSIEDVEERKKKAIRANSTKVLCTILQIRVQNVPYYTSNEAIRLKRRFFSKLLNKEFAIRIDIEKFKERNI